MGGSQLIYHKFQLNITVLSRIILSNEGICMPPIYSTDYRIAYTGYTRQSQNPMNYRDFKSSKLVYVSDPLLHCGNLTQLALCY